VAGPLQALFGVAATSSRRSRSYSAWRRAQTGTASLVRNRRDADTTHSREAFAAFAEQALAADPQSAVLPRSTGKLSRCAL